jgi:hypothetical protein
MKTEKGHKTSWRDLPRNIWADRVIKGIRTSPRDALVADSVSPEQRGLAFGFHRAAHTGGAVIGLLIAMLVVLRTQRNAGGLSASTFKTPVLVSLIPATLGVLALAIVSKDVPVEGKRRLPKLTLRGFGKPFLIFLTIIAGLLWQNVGASAPFFLSALLALIAVVDLLLWQPTTASTLGE